MCFLPQEEVIPKLARRLG